MTFNRDDLNHLDGLLSKAGLVVTMREIAEGEIDPLAIGLRHDVDNTLEGVAQLARWEHERGYRSTWFILHDSPYWGDANLRPTLEELVELGHEVGIHVNALAEAHRQDRHPDEILGYALHRLREWGHTIVGSCGHGDDLCHRHGFVNDEQFVECARPELGAPDRDIGGFRIDPRPMAYFGLEYDAYRVGTRALYLSDSGGRWNEPVAEIEAQWPSAEGQLHILQHPCWWTHAFEMVEA